MDNEIIHIMNKLSILFGDERDPSKMAMYRDIQKNLSNLLGSSKEVSTVDFGQGEVIYLCNQAS